MKRLLTVTAALSAAVLAGTTLAAPKISAQSIIVNPTQTDLSVKVYVDRDRSGNATPNYRIGQPIRITTVTNQDAYVYLFNLDGTGTVTQILPNRYGHQAGSDAGNFLKANVAKTFPAPGDNFTFTVDGPEGLNKVLAVASKTPLNLDNITQYTGSSNFASGKVQGQQQLAQALSIVVSPVPQNSWVSSTALFNVVGQRAASAGSLFVGSNVPGSTVYVNGRSLGQANTTFTGLRPGSYQLRVTTPGYREFSTTVRIRAGEVVNINVEQSSSATVQPAPAPAPIGQPIYPPRNGQPIQPVTRPPVYQQPGQNGIVLTVQSNVSGTLYIDGNPAGTLQNGSVSVNTTPGSHEVTLIAPGYRTFTSTYNLSNSATITITPAR